MRTKREDIFLEDRGRGGREQKKKKEGDEASISGSGRKILNLLPNSLRKKV